MLCGLPIVMHQRQRRDWRLAEAAFAEHPRGTSRHRLVGDRVASCKDMIRRRLYLNYAPFLANRAGFRAAELLPVPRTLRGPVEPVLCPILAIGKRKSAR